MIAAGKGNREMVTTLLEAGASKEARDEFGKTAGDYAEAGGFTNIASLLRTR
jgi:ankyrin repeat protein